MNDLSALILAAIAGAALGAVFFGGLWWTLRKALASHIPALWITSSALVRMGLTLTGFYFASAGHWQRILSCLLGFALSRVVVTWLTRPRPAPSPSPSPSPEAPHAAQS